MPREVNCTNLFRRVNSFTATLTFFCHGERVGEQHRTKAKIQTTLSSKDKTTDNEAQQPFNTTGRNKKSKTESCKLQQLGKKKKKKGV